MVTSQTYSINIKGIADTFPESIGISKDQMYQMLGLNEDATVSEFVDSYIDFMIKQEGLPPEEYADQIDLIKTELILTFIGEGIIVTEEPQIDNETVIGSYNLQITGDSTGKVILNNDIINANISLDNTNLYLGREDVFNQSQTLTLNSGNIYLNNNTTGTMHIPTLNLNGITNLSVDADLANKTMDTITADNYNIKDNAKLNVNNIILLSDAKRR